MTEENALKLFKCLSDTSRLRIVQALTQGEMYTELLAERLELTPSTVSFHMKKLEEAGLVWAAVELGPTLGEVLLVLVVTLESADAEEMLHPRVVVDAAVPNLQAPVP